MYLRVFLEGPPKSGTTRLLLSHLPGLRLRAGGWVFLPLREGEKTLGVGMLSPGEAAAPAMPYAPFRDTALDELGPEGLARKCAEGCAQAWDKGFALLDKVGGAELSTPETAGAVEALLTGELPCAGALCAREESADPSAWETLRARLAGDEHTLLLDTAVLGEEETGRPLRRWAEEIDDWMRHRRFDPLERPRFRYAKRDRRE